MPSGSFSAPADSVLMQLFAISTRILRMLKMWSHTRINHVSDVARTALSHRVVRVFMQMMYLMANFIKKQCSFQFTWNYSMLIWEAHSTKTKCLSCDKFCGIWAMVYLSVHIWSGSGHCCLGQFLSYRVINARLNNWPYVFKYFFSWPCKTDQKEGSVKLHRSTEKRI